jgi:uncharacterized protein (DUF433 family)
MDRMDWRKRILSDPEIHHGAPCVKGTRIPASILLGSMADGMTAGQCVSASREE